MKLREYVELFELSPCDILSVNHPDIGFDGPVFDVLATRFADMECDEFSFLSTWPSLAGTVNRYRVDVGWRA